MINRQKLIMILIPVIFIAGYFVFKPNLWQSRIESYLNSQLDNEGWTIKINKFSGHLFSNIYTNDILLRNDGLLMQDEGLKKVIIFSNSWSEKSISSNEETEVVYIASHDLEINHEMVKNLQKELESSENIVFIYSTNIFDALTADLSKKALSSTTWIIPSTRIANHVSKVSGKIVQASSAIDEDMIDACIKIN